MESVLPEADQKPRIWLADCSGFLSGSPGIMSRSYKAIKGVLYLVSEFRILLAAMFWNL